MPVKPAERNIHHGRFANLRQHVQRLFRETGVPIPSQPESTAANRKWETLETRHGFQPGNVTSDRRTVMHLRSMVQLPIIVIYGFSKRIGHLHISPRYSNMYRRYPLPNLFEHTVRRAYATVACAKL